MKATVSYIRIQDTFSGQVGYLGTGDDYHCVTSIRDARAFDSRKSAAAKLDRLKRRPCHFLGAGPFTSYVFTTGAD